MEIKEQIMQVVNSITGDASQMEAFQKDPAAIVKKYIGNTIPDDMINKIIDGVKAKISADTVSGIADKIGNLFKK